MLDYSSFLDSFFEQIFLTGIDVNNLSLDHIAYQASNSSEYDVLKKEFLKVGTDAHEGVVGGRRVAVFKLFQPFKYKNYRIPTLELLEPRIGKQPQSGFQHAEFVLPETFESYIAKYPNISWDTSSMNRSEFAHLKLNFKNGLTVKFLRQPILKLFEQLLHPTSLS